jgi:hypothetical protein
MEQNPLAKSADLTRPWPGVCAWAGYRQSNNVEPRGPWVRVNSIYAAAEVLESFCRVTVSA